VIYGVESLFQINQNSPYIFHSAKNQKKVKNIEISMKKQKIAKKTVILAKNW